MRGAVQAVWWFGMLREVPAPCVRDAEFRRLSSYRVPPVSPQKQEAEAAEVRVRGDAEELVWEPQGNGGSRRSWGCCEAGEWQRLVRALASLRVTAMTTPW